MPKVKIESDIKHDLLYYNWEISRKFRITSQAETEDHKYNTQKLFTVSNQVLGTDYYTKDHPLNLMGNLSQDTLFVSKLSVYLKGQEEYAETFVGIYTLAELQSGKIHDGENGFEVPCFKSSTGSTEKQDNHTVVCEIPKQEKRAFFCTDILTEEKYKEGKKAYNDPFSKEQISQELKERLKLPYPDQDEASLCGPAAFYYCLLKDRPDLYENMTWQLWKNGKTKLNNLIIKPSNDCRNIKSIKGINGLDWITLASLRDSSNALMDYDAVSDEAPGITMPSDFNKWFYKVGSKCLMDNTNLFFSKGLKELVELNSSFEKGNHVLLFIAHKIIRKAQKKNSKDHWVVLTSPIKVNKKSITINSGLNEEIETLFFTWGGIEGFKYITTLREFIEHFYGGIAIEPIK